MAYVNFGRKATRAQALASTNKDKIFFPTDAKTIILGGKEYGGGEDSRIGNLNDYLGSNKTKVVDALNEMAVATGTVVPTVTVTCSKTTIDLTTNDTESVVVNYSIDIPYFVEKCEMYLDKGEKEEETVKTPITSTSGSFTLTFNSSDYERSEYIFFYFNYKVGGSTHEAKVIFNGELRYSLEFQIKKFAYPVVDLGLPSGTLWATHNIGATSPYSYAFTAFQWGETSGNQIAETQTDTNGRTYSADNYGESYISSNLGRHSDAAYNHWREDFRMPTREDFQELVDNCTSVWTTVNGINGRLFTSKINGKTVFFPACGYCDGSSRSIHGSCGFYWSSSWHSSSLAYNLYFSSSYIDPQSGDYRYRGRAVRAVVA